VSLPIVRALRERNPDLEAVLTTITPGGREVAENQVGKTLRAVSYLPFDLPWFMRRTVAAIRPDIFVGIETEIWPNLLSSLKAAGVPAALVNARISEKSYPRYRRIRTFMASALACYDRILAQTARDRDRFLELGAPPERVAVVGNVKFDQAEEPLLPEQVAAMKADFHIPDRAPVWVVGSTRVLDEERLVWEAYHQARASLRGLVLIHAPRHVERAEAVIEAMRSCGLNPVRRTRLSAHQGSAETIILDTFGELARVYALADVAFVGNSLVPPGGGQNPLQPLAQGKPVLFGPYMTNFRDVVAEVEAARVGFTVNSSDELAHRLLQLIADADGRAQIAHRALELIRANRGAAARCAEDLTVLLRHAVPAA